MQTLLRAITILIAGAVALYVLLCVALFFYQRSLIYYPQPMAEPTSGAVMILHVDAETVAISTNPRPGPSAVIYFGGNAEDVSQEIPGLSRAFRRSAIYSLQYPGYGKSSGTPSEKAIFADSLALFDRVKVEHPDVVVIGRSLGSGVAVWVASQRPLKRLVLVTPFDSLADAAANQFPYLPVRWLLRDRYESGKYAPAVMAPTSILVAGYDEIIPRASSDRLRDRFRAGVASYVVLPGFGHNTIQNSPMYWRLVSAE
jgi:pimeloyl-ACP methyl ester carboxylesterase